MFAEEMGMSAQGCIIVSFSGVFALRVVLVGLFRARQGLRAGAALSERLRLRPAWRVFYKGAVF